MQQILVTPIPEIVTSTPVTQFINSSLFSDILNTVITLGALTFSFYMLYSFSKYGRYGRDVSKENQDKARRSLIDHGLIDPAEPGSNKNKIAANRPNVPKPRQNPVKKDENKGADEL